MSARPEFDPFEDLTFDDLPGKSDYSRLTAKHIERAEQNLRRPDWDRHIAKPHKAPFLLRVTVFALIALVGWAAFWLIIWAVQTGQAGLVILIAGLLWATVIAILIKERRAGR